MTEFADFVTVLADVGLSLPFLRRPATVLIARFAPDAEPTLASDVMLHAGQVGAGKALETIVREWPLANTRLSEADPAFAAHNARSAALSPALAEPGLHQYLEFIDRAPFKHDVQKFNLLTGDLRELAGRFEQPEIQQRIGQTWLKAAETLIANADGADKATIIDRAFRLHGTSKEMTGIAADFLLAHIGDLTGEHAAKRQSLYCDAAMDAENRQNGREHKFAYLWGQEMETITARLPSGSYHVDFLYADAIRRYGEKSAIGQVAASKTDKRLVTAMNDDSRGALIAKDQLRAELAPRRRDNDFRVYD